MQTLSRRDFVVAMAAAGGGLLIGCRVGRNSSSAGDVEQAFSPNAFVRIGTDGSVTVISPQAEIGQGSYTAMPMLVAEELEVGLDQVKVELAGGDDKLYGEPGLFQLTGGSSSVRAFYEPLRQAGAAARMMLVAAAASKWGVDPSTCHAQRGVVSHQGSGRTLTYGSLATAAATQTVPTQITLKDPKDFTLIGTSAKRLDTPSKTNGTAQFGLDVKVPGMKIATLAQTPVLGGKVASIDEAKAMAVPGVRQVVKLDDVVAVVGDHMWAAKQGLTALNVKWDDGSNASIATDDVLKDIAAASTTSGVVARKVGDGADGFARAARRIDAEYHVPFLAHAALEPLNVTVHVRPDGCDVWHGSQVQGRARGIAADVTGLPVEKVALHSQLIGGAFGRRLHPDYMTTAMRIAKNVEGPVKIVWTREEDMQHDVYRPFYYDRISAGLDAKGKPVAWMHRICGPSIFAKFLPPAFKDGIDPDAVDTDAQMLYDIPSIQIEYLRHEEPILNTGFWRGVGNTHNDFVMESFMDELAHAAHQDPVAYRRALLGHDPRAQAVLDLVAEKSGWGKPLPSGHARGVAFLYCSWNTYMAQVAEVAVSPKGQIRVVRVVCACDCGQMVSPDGVEAQIQGGMVFGISGALWGEITLKNGRVQQNNFPDYRVLRMNENPVIEVHLVRNHEKPGGMGEPATTCVEAAIANAIYAATGKRLRVEPLEPALIKALS